MKKYPINSIALNKLLYLAMEVTDAIIVILIIIIIMIIIILIIITLFYTSGRLIKVCGIFVSIGHREIV